jgi:hypothetical protein
MAKVAKGNVRMDQSFDIVAPPCESAIPVPIKLWNRFVERLDSDPGQAERDESKGWGLVGAGAGFIANALMAPLGTTFFPVDEKGNATINFPGCAIEGVAAFLGALFLGWGFILLSGAKRRRLAERETRAFVREDMLDYLQQFQSLPSSPIVRVSSEESPAS